MITFHDSRCSGCTACYAACPVNAISMVADDEGFAFPKIDYEKCINCGKCDQVCQINNPYKNKFHDYSYIAQTKNEQELAYATSGGMFPIIARSILKKGGLICGCILDDNCVARHVLSDDLNIIKKMSGSKYVQSELGNVFKDIKKILKTGRYVLFSGTPCQVSGLMSYLAHPYENLYTMDIMCYGVPSPLLFKKHIEPIIKLNQEVKSFLFRNKKYGWRTSSSFTWLDQSGNELKYFKWSDDKYMTNFVNGNAMRKSCHQCSFCTPQRPSDFTVGDFWAIDEKSVYFDDRGISFIIFNTGRALQWLKDNDNEFAILERITIKEIGQTHFYKPFFRGKKRTKVYRELIELVQSGENND